MTDVVVTSKDGRVVHFYIDDGLPAFVSVRELGSISVSRYNPALDERIRELARRVKRK